MAITKIFLVLVIVCCLRYGHDLLFHICIRNMRHSWFWGFGDGYDFVTFSFAVSKLTASTLTLSNVNAFSESSLRCTCWYLIPLTMSKSVKNTQSNNIVEKVLLIQLCCCFVWCPYTCVKLALLNHLWRGRVAVILENFY